MNRPDPRAAGGWQPGYEVQAFKISLLILLSNEEDYNGGDVVLTGRITMPKRLGSGCVIPSWVPHRVDQVTEGTRYSLAAWAHGAWFN